MPGTHFKGPIYGDRHTNAGLGRDLPIDIIEPSEWVIYRNDFLRSVSDYDATNDFTLTQITAGSAAIASADPVGTLVLDCPANDQGPIIQLVRPSITPAAASASAAATEAVMMARFNLLDADASDSFIGFAELNATSAVLEADGDLTSDTHAGFHVKNADNGVFKISVAGSVDTTAVTQSSVFTAADSTYVDVGVRVVGTRTAHFYYRPSGLRAESSGKAIIKNWSHVGTLTNTEAWDAAMFPTIAHVGEGTGDDLTLDLLVVAVRRFVAIG